MSPRKLTEDDKQEILEQYRNSEATTSTLAKSFEVSSSTISRFLKNKLTTTEYEDLIQQKRLARTPRGEKQLKAKADSSKAKSTKKAKAKTKDNSAKGKKKKVKQAAANQDAIPELAVAENLQQDAIEAVKEEPVKEESVTEEPVAIEAVKEESVKEEAVTEEPVTEEPVAEKPERLRRRRSRTAASQIQPETQTAKIQADDSITEAAPEIIQATIPAPEADANPPAKLVLDDVKSKADNKITLKSERLILKSEKSEVASADLESKEEDDDDDEMDMLALKEMLGEELEDINDEEDEEDDWDDDDDTPYTAASNLSDIQILPLSQASLPRICYLVIDRSAELIVKPLAEFADLGAIPDAETNQKTLPVFDNHRIAKRFSHRRERVIKVPDSRMLQKTSHHLQDKGITRLLVDGQIYSLS